MHRISFRHIVTLALMGIFLLGTVPGLQAYVWCVKEEGSTALESDTHGTCAPAPALNKAHSEHPPECCSSGAHPHGHSCELCIDIPLDTEFSKVSKPQLKKISAAPHAPQWCELQLLRNLIPEVSCTQLPQPPPHIRTALRVHRTTVLII